MSLDFKWWNCVLCELYCNKAVKNTTKWLGAMLEVRRLLVKWEEGKLPLGRQRSQCARFGK